MTLEETYIKNIESGIRAIKFGTKSPSEAKVGFNLNRLKEVNPGMYEDLMRDYKKAMEEYKNREGKPEMNVTTRINNDQANLK